MAYSNDILDNLSLHWTYPHLRPRLAYVQDPSTSCWRIEVTGLSHLPSVAHPKGRLKSAGSPWPETSTWLHLSDAERRARAEKAWRHHELFVEMKPVPGMEGEETREQRRERLLNSEDEVEAMQEKEAILEAGRGRERDMVGQRKRRESLAREIENVEGLKGCEEAVVGTGSREGKDEAITPGIGIGRAGVEKQVRKLHGAVGPAREADMDVEEGLNLPKTPLAQDREASMTDDGPFIDELAAANKDGAGSLLSWK